MPVHSPPTPTQVPRQLPLPVNELPVLFRLPAEMTSLSVTPQCIWKTLTLAQQAHARRIFRRVAQELLEREGADD